MNFKKKLDIRTREERNVIIISLIITGFLVILDQVTKVLIVQNIALYSKIEIIPNFFDLVYVKNDGAAWNMLSGQKILLLLISLFALIGIVIYFRSLCEECIERYYGLGLILSGIIGNAFDRIWRNEVVDFLDFYIKSYHWPAFNVADSAIVVGAAIFIISSLLRTEKKIAPKS